MMQISFRPSGVALPAEARVIVVPVEQDASGTDWAAPQPIDGAIKQAAADSRFTAKPSQLFETIVPHGDGAVRMVLLGLGKADEADRGRIAELAGAALVARFLRSGTTMLAVDFSSSSLDAGAAARLLLGAWLRGWHHDRYRTRLADEKRVTLTELVIINAPEGTQAAWADAKAVADGVAFTRELVTEPANIIYPVSFVERCQKLAAMGVEITVLDDDAMRALGMGALLGVGQGSAQPSRLIAMRWNGKSAADAGKPLVLVGKGVTFDTGGISLKPGAGMEDMKWDMGGAGAVAGTMMALAGRKAKAHVVGICGLVENMPDAKAQRPGDVVTSMSGQTIEVINTDAEGRLVLCDALTWAQREYAPETIIDLATLTGAIIVSLGHEHAGLFSNDDGLAADLTAAGLASGDKLWRFPLSPAYDKLIDSPIADIKNVGPRYGGSITAAQFLQRFIDAGVKWAHLDIAGMVWADAAGGTWDKGATGYGVRLLDAYVRAHHEG